MPRKLLTADEAAEALAVAPITVRRAFYDGRLRGIKIGKALRFAPEALEAFIEACAVQAEATK